MQSYERRDEMYYLFKPRKEPVDYEKCFDEKENLLYIPIEQTTTPFLTDEPIYAHHILESLNYAFYLLRKNETENKDKAIKIIKKTLHSQCVNKNSQNFGYWTYFSDKRLAHLSPKDIPLNCRIATTLLHIYTMHEKILPPKLKQNISEKISNSIYTFSTAYTYLSSSSLVNCIYLAFRYGKLTDSNEFITQGETILQKLYNDYMYHNSFYEYNNMNSLPEQILFLCKLASDMTNEKNLRLIEFLIDKSWETFAMHFHYETKQISGPFSITLYDRTADEIYDFLYHALGGRLDLPHSEKELPCECVCPEKYLPYFAPNTLTGFSQSIVFRGMTAPIFRQSIVQSNYMKKYYTLGSFNREFFWELRRPFVGYFAGEKNPYCFKIDVLHDFFGYASAALHSVQHDGNAIGHITFVTDGGDKHTNQDAPNPSITAKDFRIRFSISGDIEDLSVKHNKNTLEVMCKGAKLYYSVPLCEFDGFEIKTGFMSDESNLFFDMIIHSGDPKVIDFKILEKAIFRFSFLITSTGKTLPPTTDRFENGKLVTSAEIDKLPIELQTPHRPCLRAESFVYDSQIVGGVPLEEYVTKLTNQIRDIEILEQKNIQNASYFPYLSGDEETGKILAMIDGIRFVSTDTLTAEVKKILELTEKTSYSLELHKRIAIQLVITIFEAVKKISYKFNDVIDRKHYNIYQKITGAVAPEAISEEIIKLCRAIEKEAPFFQKSEKNKTVGERIREIITDNLLNPDLSLNFIADILGYSSSYLSRIFFEATGMTYTEYIQKEKINYAIKELETKNMTVKAVAEKLGYSGSNNFIRMFGKVTGMTITQYMNKKDR